MTATADVLDAHPDSASVCRLPFVSYGGLGEFEGPIATVRCHEDNVLLRGRVEEPGAGRVLVVDGGGSTRVALLGDRLAGLAVEHGWAGLVIHGAVRDVRALAGLPIGVVALASTPRPSAKTGDGEIDVAVSFGDVTFEPGEMLYRDEDGIVVLAARA